MSIPNNILQKMNSGNSSLPNYIPVKNMADFNYDVISYYNQYYASAKTTQNRRIMRNYLNNQASIKKSNKNPFMNNAGKKFNFFYSYAQNFMIVENKNNSIDIFILINKCWCHQSHLPDKNNCKVLENIVLNNEKVR